MIYFQLFAKFKYYLSHMYTLFRAKEATRGCLEYRKESCSATATLFGAEGAT